MIGVPRDLGSGPSGEDAFVSPSDVVEAAELSREDKIAILERWRAHAMREAPTTVGTPTLAEIDALLERLVGER